VDLRHHKGDASAYFMDMACDRGHAVMDAIMECQPTTLAGLAVMARAAQLEIQWWWNSPDGELDEDCLNERGIQFDLAEAILAMAAA
jgi:hypothetical protein